jgi:methionine aminotransferase
MSALAAETGAINLSQGFPDFGLDPELAAVLTETISRPVHQYAPMQGILPLRETISKLIATHYQRSISPEDILITAGATQGIFTTIQALTGPGDEVIILDPAYDCYRPAVTLSRARAVHIPLTDSFEPDMERIKSALNAKTRMLVLNNPHNPSGMVFSKKQMNELASLLEPYPKCVILSDEVYEFIQFGTEQVSMNFYPRLWDRTVIISSFGKTLHITGWKLGYLTAPPALLNEIRKVHQYLVFSVNHFAQVALDTYLQSFDISSLVGFFEAKRNLLQTFIRNSAFRLLPCEGTYFQMIDISEVTEMDDVAYAVWLTRDAGLATIPLSVFYEKEAPQNYLRLCFAKSDTLLEKAGAILQGIH